LHDFPRTDETASRQSKRAQYTQYIGGRKAPGGGEFFASIDIPMLPQVRAWNPIPSFFVLSSKVVSQIGRKWGGKATPRAPLFTTLPDGYDNGFVLTVCLFATEPHCAILLNI
jgi:hypothetical protein